uniref:Uncharacterized protein n=1 Tax=Bionectria ochroleuca TaxID=29856 RepID=A0A0B7KEQ4_BIOOC
MAFSQTEDQRRMEGIDNHLWMFLHFNDEYAQSVIMTYNAVQWTIFNLHDGVMPTGNLSKNDNISKIQISSKEESGMEKWVLVWTCFSGKSIRSVDAQSAQKRNGVTITCYQAFKNRESYLLLVTLPEGLSATKWYGSQGRRIYTYFQF